MKKKVLLRLIIAQALFLVACDNSIDSNDSSEANQGQENKETIIKEQIDSDYYRPVITEDGTYAPSKNRGITRSLNSNVNMRTFEVDLMRHSQPYFSVDDYFFQEGQYLSSELVTSWLRREEASEAESDEESDKQMQGLNPPANESEDAGERVPNILNSILEQNFYIQTENGLEFAGVSIGLALNSVDYYQLAQYEATYEQEISREKVLEEGQRIGNEVVSRIRNIEGLENIPVMIGLYEQSARDDLAPGTFIATGLSEKDQTEVSDWKKINEERVIFPLEGMHSAVGNNFAN
ncbi:MAG: CamS family sex pheromone protein, partial [Alkalibacterium sp.]|nr:CamS family sex pheromone protein [Alkalibacterium sp.]